MKVRFARFVPPNVQGPDRGCFLKGFDARWRGVPRNKNPYKLSLYWNDWLDGWNCAALALECGEITPNATAISKEIESAQ